MLAQEERSFHRDERYPQTHHLPPAPSEEARTCLTDLGNPKNPLGQVWGNDQARKRLCDAAFTALARYNHVCNDVAFLLTGPKGAHKREIARRFAELLRLPFIEINPATIKTGHELFIEIGNGLQRAGLPLVECKGPGRSVLPPCVIFLDDCHDLKQKPNVWTALLQAVAVTDPTLRTEQGVHVKTLHATWLLATTNRAELIDGLPDRFTELALTTAASQAQHASNSGDTGTAKPNVPTTANQLAASAAALLAKGELDRAIADASEAILLHAPCIEAYAVRSEAYRKKYEIDRAIADATEAIRLAPNSPLGFFHRAAAYRIDFIRNKQ